MQAATTDDLIFCDPGARRRTSRRLMTLEPGDIVSTGTPVGGRLRHATRRLAEPGDELAISSPTLGLLETRIG